MPPDELNAAILEIQLDMREIKTLIQERQKRTEENARNIGQAFNDIHSLDKEVKHAGEENARNSERISRMEKTLDEKLDELARQLEKLRESYEARTKELEASINAMNEIKHQVKYMWAAFTTAMLALAGVIFEIFTR